MDTFHFHQTIWHLFIPNTLSSPYQCRYPVFFIDIWCFFNILILLFGAMYVSLRHVQSVAFNKKCTVGILQHNHCHVKEPHFLYFTLPQIYLITSRCCDQHSHTESPLNFLLHKLKASTTFVVTLWIAFFQWFFPPSGLQSQRIVFAQLSIANCVSVLVEKKTHQTKLSVITLRKARSGLLSVKSVSGESATRAFANLSHYVYFFSAYECSTLRVSANLLGHIRTL